MAEPQLDRSKVDAQIAFALTAGVQVQEIVLDYHHSKGKKPSHSLHLHIDLSDDEKWHLVFRTPRAGVARAYQLSETTRRDPADAYMKPALSLELWSLLKKAGGNPNATLLDLAKTGKATRKEISEEKNGSFLTSVVNYAPKG